MTLETYDALLEAQGGVCGGCGRQPGEQQALAVDEDHDTGEVDGLLCPLCNRALKQYLRRYILDPPARRAGIHHVVPEANRAAAARRRTPPERTPRTAKPRPGERTTYRAGPDGRGLVPAGTQPAQPATQVAAPAAEGDYRAALAELLGEGG
jgi:hypothetical protein